MLTTLLLVTASLYGQSFEMAMVPKWAAYADFIDERFAADAVDMPFQQPSITVPALHFTYGLQPLEALKTVAGRRVPGLALAEVTACLDFGAPPMRLSQIRLTQYLHSQGVEPVMASLAISTLDNASAISFPEVGYQVASFAGQAASILMAAETIAASPAIQVGVLLATRGAELLLKRGRARIDAAVTLSKFQLDGSDIDMQPGQCISRAPLVRWPVKKK